MKSRNSKKYGNGEWLLLLGKEKTFSRQTTAVRQRSPHIHGRPLVETVT